MCGALLPARSAAALRAAATPPVSAAVLVTLPPPARQARAGRAQWAIVDSNHGPPPYQSGALTN